MKTYELTFQKNIRDIGGLVGLNNRPIKYGKLFRGGALIKVKDVDVSIVESFHLTDIVDFRSTIEFKYRPDYQIKGVTYHNFPTLKEDKKKEKEVAFHDDGNLLWFIQPGDTGFNHLKRTYDELVVTKEAINAYKKFFKLLVSSNDKTIYFHCSQGKDRAGFAAFLIEMALGVSYDDAMEDYLLSNVAMEVRAESLLRSVEDKKFFNEEYKQSLFDVFSAKKEYIDSVINKMNELYGGTMNFIQNILKVDIDKLREIYLD